jgi:glycosyltransferase involved in cell wall biosynthesis
MKPLVTIGMPIKNGFKNNTNDQINLEKALSSVLNQSYKNLEIIISNNCSEDETGSFLKKMSKKDNRIKYFDQKYEIPGSGNFDFVLKKATGKYFKWNCHDDIISHDFIEKNIEFLENNLDYSCSSSKFGFEDEMQNLFTHNIKGNLYLKIKNFFKVRFSSHNIFYSVGKTKFFIESSQMNHTYLANDWLTSIYLLTKGNFKTIENGFLIVGNGDSRSKDFFKSHWFKVNLIASIIPLYHFTKNFLKLILNFKKLSYIEKIILSLICIKINLTFSFRKFKYQLFS